MNNNIFTALNTALNSEEIGAVQIFMSVGEVEIVAIQRPHIVADENVNGICFTFDDNSFFIPKTMSGEVITDEEVTVYTFKEGTVKIEVVI